MFPLELSNLSVRSLSALSMSESKFSSSVIFFVCPSYFRVSLVEASISGHTLSVLVLLIMDPELGSHAKLER